MHTGSMAKSNNDEIIQELLSLTSFLQIHVLNMEKWIYYMNISKELNLDNLSKMIVTVMQSINSINENENSNEILRSILLIMNELEVNQRKCLDSTKIQNSYHLVSDVSLHTKNIKGYLYRMNTIADYIADCFSKLMVNVCSMHRPSVNINRITNVQELLDINARLNALQCITIYTNASMAILQHYHILCSIIREFNTRKKNHDLYALVSISELNEAERAKLICANSSLTSFFNYNTEKQTLNDMTIFGENKNNISDKELNVLESLLNKIDLL